jgi:NADP-dependent 3-hydroxy acid dehydrogenase YdfG
MSETQRVAIVTGAAGGIGRAMTQGLLAAGIRVAGVDRDREPLEALAANSRGTCSRVSAALVLLCGPLAADAGRGRDEPAS